MKRKHTLLGGCSGLLILACVCLFGLGSLQMLMPGNVTPIVTEAGKRPLEQAAEPSDVERAGNLSNMTGTAVATQTLALEQSPQSNPAAVSTPAPTTFVVVVTTRVVVLPNGAQGVTAASKVSLIVRDGPGTLYKQIGSLKQGERVNLLGISPDKQWVQHSKGWSAIAYLTITGDIHLLKVVLVNLPAPRPPTVKAVSVPPSAIPVISNSPPAIAPSSGVRVGAICRDGTRSSATGRGACSHHGGVAYWLYQ